MNISTTSLTTERRWRSATGYDEKRFRKLLSKFEDAYYGKFGKILLERKADSPKESVIKSAEDLLLFTLFSLKSGLTYDLLGFVTGMDASNAKRNRSGEPSGFRGKHLTINAIFPRLCACTILRKRS